MVQSAQRCRPRDAPRFDLISRFCSAVLSTFAEKRSTPVHGVSFSSDSSEPPFSDLRVCSNHRDVVYVSVSLLVLLCSVEAAVAHLHVLGAEDEVGVGRALRVLVAHAPLAVRAARDRTRYRCQHLCNAQKACAWFTSVHELKDVLRVFNDCSVTVIRVNIRPFLEYQICIAFAGMTVVLLCCSLPAELVLHLV